MAFLLTLLMLSSCVFRRDGFMFLGLMVDGTHDGALIRRPYCFPPLPPSPKGFCVGEPTAVRYDASK